MVDVLILNGPNIDRLGTREPQIYGTGTYANLVAACEAQATDLGLTIDVRQTQSEGQLITWLHEAADAGVHVILNPAALTHYSLAVADACAMLTGLLIEVHLSNIAAREEFRHKSVTAAHAQGVIAGFGFDSYRLALQAIAARRG
ncbi:MAG: type II 3-dehydroquinate dehydratase [Actinomycetales bacterium]